jgi:NTP pyrophosphatase (non-canonical NTP hydrolase)
MKLDLNHIQAVSITRSNRWHNGDFNEWSALEWAGAMCGEAGEAANAAKKLKRLENKLVSLNSVEENRHYNNKEEAKQAIGKEVADTILYGVLLMARAGITDPETIIKEVFNAKSIEYGFPERL